MPLFPGDDNSFVLIVITIKGDCSAGGSSSQWASLAILTLLLTVGDEGVVQGKC